MHRPLLSGTLALVLAISGCSDSNPGTSMPDADSMFGTDAGVGSGTSVPSPLQPAEACTPEHEPRGLVDELVERDPRADDMPPGTYNVRYVGAEDELRIFEDIDGNGWSFVLYPTLPLPLEPDATYQIDVSALGYAISAEGNFIAFVGSRGIRYPSFDNSSVLVDGLTAELKLYCDFISSSLYCREIRHKFMDLEVAGVGRYGLGDHILEANGNRYELSIRDLREASGSITGCSSILPHSYWFTLKPTDE